MFAELTELTAYLSACQEKRVPYIKCELTQALSARMRDAALVELLVTALPMAQGIQHRVIRSRGKGAVLTAKLRYRDGVRMLSYWRSGEGALSEEDEASLDAARQIAAEAAKFGTEEARFRHVYEWICGNIRYAHTAPGKLGYERLVGASAVLADRAANCQGFADVLYLLCGLCGIECRYCCGRGERRLHLWNAVRLNGEWLEVDASRGARRLSLAHDCGNGAKCVPKV